jgi:hypothetical protein
MIKPTEEDIEERENTVPHIYDLNTSWRNWLIWRFFDKAILPFSGGFMEQPTWVLDDLMVIESEYNTIREQMDGG